jgi:hypothetical protein
MEHFINRGTGIRINNRSINSIGRAAQGLAVASLGSACLQCTRNGAPFLTNSQLSGFYVTSCMWCALRMLCVVYVFIMHIACVVCARVRVYVYVHL